MGACVGKKEKSNEELGKREGVARLETRARGSRGWLPIAQERDTTWRSHAAAGWNMEHSVGVVGARLPSRVEGAMRPVERRDRSNRRWDTRGKPLARAGVAQARSSPLLPLRRPEAATVARANTFRWAPVEQERKTAVSLKF